MQTGQGQDTGDLIQPDEEDVTPVQITDPNHPDYVEPYEDATRPYVVEEG